MILYQKIQTTRISVRFKKYKYNKNVISLYDCVIIVTNHDCFNYEMIQKNSTLLVDTCGVYKKYKNVVRA